MENEFIVELGKMILDFEKVISTEADRHSKYLPKGVSITPSYGEVEFLMRKEIYNMLDILKRNTEMDEEEVFELIIYNGIKYIHNTLIEKEKAPDFLGSLSI